MCFHLHIDHFNVDFAYESQLLSELFSMCPVVVSETHKTESRYWNIDLMYFFRKDILGNI